MLFTESNFSIDHHFAYNSRSLNSIIRFVRSRLVWTTPSKRPGLLLDNLLVQAFTHVFVAIRDCSMITIIDYEAGNLRSVQRACHRVGIASVVTADPAEVEKAERIIFPGVGAATSAVDTLRERKLDEALKYAFHQGIPILGICLGTQIILEYTEEDDRQCLGLVAGVCKRFELEDRSLKVPHMGWNGVEVVQPHPLLESVENGDEFYFVHSYYPCPANTSNIYGVTEYGLEFCSVVGKRNLFATQFHIEKSGQFGLSILERFCHWDGTI